MTLTKRTVRSDGVSSSTANGARSSASHSSAVDRLTAYPHAFDHTDSTHTLFLEAMRENFKHHFKHCPEYARYAELLDVHPQHIVSYSDVFRIPHIFVANFKHRDFVTGRRDRIRLTLTSSGTSGEKSQIHLDARSLSRIRRIVRNIYRSYGMTDETPTNYLCFTYDPRQARDLGTAFSDKLLTSLTRVHRVVYTITKNARGVFELDRDRCFRALERFAKEGCPVRLLGFPALMWDVLREYHAGNCARLHFGSSSWVIPGGGWKDKSNQEIPKMEFRQQLGEWLGIPSTNVRDLYGMVEHGVPYCECEHFHMHVPIYSRVVARDPVTLHVLPSGEFGLLHMLTPYLNSYPALSLLTSDWGRVLQNCPCGRSAPYIELRGRVGTTTHRGCAIAALDVIRGEEDHVA